MSARRVSPDGAELSVDHTLCSGTGHCADRLPQLFTVRDGRAWLAEETDLSALGEEHLRQVEAGCPWFAITYRPHPAQEPTPDTAGLE